MTTTPKLPIASSDTVVNIDHAAATLLLAQLSSVPAAAQAAMEEAVDDAVAAATATAEAASGAAGLAQAAAEAASVTAVAAKDLAVPAAATATSKAASAEASAVQAEAARDLAVAAANAANQVHTLYQTNVVADGSASLYIDGNTGAFFLEFPGNFATKVARVVVLLEARLTTGNTFQFLGTFEGKIFLAEDGTPYCNYQGGSPTGDIALAPVGTPLAASGVVATVTLTTSISSNVPRIWLNAVVRNTGANYSLRGHVLLEYHPSISFVP